jgi:hypothetical protein
VVRMQAVLAHDFSAQGGDVVPLLSMSGVVQCTEAVYI